MGFRSSITPTRLATNAELVVEDTHNYAAGELKQFTIGPDLFGGYDPLRIELISDPTFAWLHCDARIFPPNETGTNAALGHGAMTAFRGFLPIQPIGGQVRLDVRNSDTFGGNMTIRAYRLRGVRSFADVVRSVIDGPARFGSSNLGAGNTASLDVKGSGTYCARLRGIATMDRAHDLEVIWRDTRFGGTLVEWTQVIGAGIVANTVTEFDLPWLGLGEARVLLRNNGAAGAVADASVHAVPLI